MLGGLDGWAGLGVYLLFVIVTYKILIIDMPAHMEDIEQAEREGKVYKPKMFKHFFSLKSLQ